MSTRIVAICGKSCNGLGEEFLDFSGKNFAGSIKTFIYSGFSAKAVMVGWWIGRLLPGTEQVQLVLAYGDQLNVIFRIMTLIFDSTRGAVTDWKSSGRNPVFGTKRHKKRGKSSSPLPTVLRIR